MRGRRGTGHGKGPPGNGPQLVLVPAHRTEPGCRGRAPRQGPVRTVRLCPPLPWPRLPPGCPVPLGSLAPRTHPPALWGPSSTSPSPAPHPTHAARTPPSFSPVCPRRPQALPSNTTASPAAAPTPWPPTASPSWPLLPLPPQGTSSTSVLPRRHVRPCLLSAPKAAEGPPSGCHDSPLSPRSHGASRRTDPSQQPPGPASSHRAAPDRLSVTGPLHCPVFPAADPPPCRPSPKPGLTALSPKALPSHTSECSGAWVGVC